MKKDQELKEIAEEMKRIPGNVKGEVFLNHAEYIRRKEGDQGIGKVEEKMAELGIPIKLREVDPKNWESEGVSSLVVVVAKEIFGWTEEDIFEWGRFRTRVSAIIKILARTIISIRKVLEEAPKYWDKNFDFGSIEAFGLDEEKKEFFLRVRDFKTHPLICLFHAGYFKGMAELCLKSDKIKVEETKCMHKGDSYHEYKVTW